jgi:ACDE family multidrug resistance protein
VIIGSASGGIGGAVMLYEAALGLGISDGPLLGGELGAVSWYGRFFGVALPIAIAFVATLVFLDRAPAPVAQWASLRPRALAPPRDTRRP